MSADGEDTVDAPAAESIRQWAGRGGAGNFGGSADAAAAAATAADTELVERERGRVVSEEVRRKVEAGLVRPGNVHLGGRSE